MPSSYDSAVAKAKEFLESEEGKEKIDKALTKKTKGGKNPIKMAGIDFANVLKNQINALSVPSGSDVSHGGLGETAVMALTQIDIEDPVLLKDGMYSIGISFSGDLSRPSLNPDKYDGIQNLAALLNNGYATRRPVHGTWHGEDKWGLMKRQGANFIGSAVANFKSNYSSKYKIISIEVDNAYKI